jgi:hypothetical protein
VINASNVRLKEPAQQCYKNAHRTEVVFNDMAELMRLIKLHEYKMCKSDIIFLSIFLFLGRASKTLFEINKALKEEIDSYYSQKI